MKEILTGWETTRLSKHFILLDFLASNVVYRSGTPLAFDEIWNDEHYELAKGLCNDLLEPLMEDERVGPISIADAFWPAVFKGGFAAAFGPKHRWTGGEATVDIALYRLIDEGKRNDKLKKAVENIEAIDKFRDRVISYPNTEFLCLTFKPVGAKNCGVFNPKKAQNLRARHVRVGRYFNMLDFCRNGRAVEEGIILVPENAENDDGRVYCPIPEETAARSFAAALDPLVEDFGRISVVRGMETPGFAADEYAELHRWDQDGPWRLVFVLPQEVDPQKARAFLSGCAHVCNVEASRHASESFSLALVVDQKDYEEHYGLRPDYSRRKDC